MTIEHRIGIIGIIGGNGWLGSAIASAAVSSRAVDPARLTVSGRNDPSTFPDLPGVHRTNSNAELAERSDVVILSVGPAQFADVRIDASNKLVVSVMAGITAARIAERTGATEVVRTIPDAAAAIGRSFTPWYATPPVGASSKAVVRALFEACGEASEVPQESHIDYCVGMTGSGAAFPALLAEAMIAHAVGQGLPRVCGTYRDRGRRRSRPAPRPARRRCRAHRPGNDRLPRHHGGRAPCHARAWVRRGGGGGLAAASARAAA